MAVSVALSNARSIVRVALMQVDSGRVTSDGVTAFNLGEVDGHSIEFAVGVEADFFGDGSEHDMVAMFGSSTDISEPPLWFSFDHRNGEIVGFQFHEEYAHVEYSADDLMEWWEARLQKLATNITGLSLIDGGQSVVDGQHRRMH